MENVIKMGRRIKHLERYLYDVSLYTNTQEHSPLSLSLSLEKLPQNIEGWRRNISRTRIDIGLAAAAGWWPDICPRPYARPAQNGENKRR